MTNKPLFKNKSALTKRRLLIFFILSTIVTVSVMTGFSSGLNSDGTIYTAAGERIVMWKELPEDGTPEDYDLLSNIGFVAQRIYTSPYYRGVTEGLVIANVGMGIKYRQNVDNVRVVKGDTIFVQAISSSSLKNIAEQRYYVGNNVFLRQSTSASSSGATFADSISKFDTEAYYRAYGVIPNELTKLKVDETTILSVRDDNATVVAAKNSADGAELNFEVPQTLVADSEGNYSVTLDLDPAESTKYSRNEVRTLAGADQNPLYYSSGLTIKFTSEWKPISVIAFDNYDIAIPVLGAMNCSTTMTETFYDIDDENGEVPEKEFFEERMGDVTDDDIPSGQLSPADYLAAAFAKYLDGSETLDLVANIDIAGIAINDLALSVNIGTMNIRAKLDELAIEYTDDRLYITLNDIKGYFSVDKLTSLMSDPAISSLLGNTIGELPDFDNLLGDDILSVVFGACEMTTEDGITCIRLPFALAENISIDASLYISNDDMSLVGISGTVKAFGLNIKLDAKPKSVKFPKIDDTYVCFDYALDFVPDAINTIASTAYGINGTVKFNDYELDIDAYIDRADGIKADATVGVLGLNVGIKYINNDIYISVGNIDIHATLDDLSKVIDIVGRLTDIDIKEMLGIDVMEKLLGTEITLETFDRFLPHTVPEWIATIKSLAVTENSLKLGVSLPVMPINIGLTRANGKLDSIKLDAKLVMLTKITKLSADLNIATPANRAVTAPTDYVELSDVLDLVPTFEKLINAKAFDIDLDVDVAGYHIDGDVTLAIAGGIAASGNITALGQTVDIIYIDGEVFVMLGNIKLKLAVNDVAALLARFGIELPVDLSNGLDFGSLVADVDIPSVLGLALGAVKSIVKTDDGIIANIEMSGISATLTVGDEIKLAASLGNANVGLTLGALDTAPSVTPPADSDDYIDIATLGDTIDGVLDIIANKAFSGNVSLSVGGNMLNIGLSVTFGNGIKLRITEDTLDLEAVIDADIENIVDTVVYVSIADIKLYGTLADIVQIVEAIAPALPEDIGGIITGVLDKLDSAKLPDTDSISPIVIAGILDNMLGMISSVTDTPDNIAATIVINETAIGVTLRKDLYSIGIDTTAFGKTVGITVDGITASASPITDIDGAVHIANLLPVVGAVVPYIGADGLKAVIDGSIALDDENVVSIGGYVALELNPVKAEVMINVGDVKLDVVYDGKNIYVNIDNKLKLSVVATKDGIMELIADLKTAFDGIEELEDAVNVFDKIADFISTPIDFNILALLNDVTLASYTDESSTYVTVGYSDTVLATIGMTDGAMRSLDIELILGDNTLALSAALGTTDDGYITIDTAYDFVSLGIALVRDDDVTVSAVTKSEYTDIGALVGYIKPIAELALNAMDAKTVSFDINAKVTMTDGNWLDIASKDLVISIGDGVAVSGSLVLFAGTGADSETAVEISFVNNEVYIKLGGIMLKLDTKADIDRLYEIAGKYLPDYLTEELGKLLGKVNGTSAFSDIGLIVDKIKAAASSPDIKTALNNLLGGYGGLSSDSTLKKLLAMVSLSATADNLTIGADLGFISLSVTPVITADGLTSAVVTTNLLGADIYLSASSLDVSDIATAIMPPADSAEYVSVIDFVAIVDNLVGTFTTRTEDGSITFEIADFMFSYEAKTEDGTSVTIRNMDGYSALKGKFTPHVTPAVTDGNIEISPETTEYSISLEMHITLDLPASAAKLGTLGIELYLIDNYPDSPLAYLNYTEFYGNNDKNIGELVSIDARSVLQILAAVMDIIGVNDDTVETLLGKYRRNIDTTLFDSMDIVGLDSVKTLLDDLTMAINEVKLGLKDLTSALDSVMNAGSIDNLRGNIDGIKDSVSAAVEHVQNALQAFGIGTDEDEETVTPTASALRGDKVKSVTDGIGISRGDGYISADVDNTLTTGADGVANITVTEENNTITGVDITNLDADKSLVNGSITFTSGRELEFSPIPTAPSYSTYSNLANLKHILFDIMNTANLMEFDIGGYDTSDSIDVSLDLKNISGGALLQYLAKLNISIKYNVKVKLIPSGTDDNGKTTYKTAVVVELIYENCTASILGSKVQVVPDCVTRLYFYDNVLYIQGISDWNDYQTSIGNVDVLYKATRKLKSYSENFTSDYNVDGMKVVNVAYTIDEFVYMIGNDMNKFLKEFLFYLVPVSKKFSFLNINLQDTIADLIPTSDTTTEKTEDTLARIFKGYSYDGSKHTLVLGLKELAGNDSLSDVTVEIVGRNDGDDDDGLLLNNYISNLMVTTSIQDGLVTATLNASLNNVRVTERNTIESKGLAPTDVSTVNAAFKHNNRSYVNLSGYTPDTLYTLDGSIYDADGELYVEHGSKVLGYYYNGADPTTSTVSNGSCEVDIPSGYGWVVGDILWSYQHTYNLNGDCYLPAIYTYYVGSYSDGTKYIYRVDGGNTVNVAAKSIIGSLLAEAVTVDGKIVSLNNRTGGVQWSRPWQAAYEASITA